MSLCGHTILGGRKGLTVLDTRKDWRFENNPTAQSFGPMFYAGVPLMSPNMDGSKEAEKNACPLGALCVASFEPRESFSLEDRKRLVYMSEYARREIASWFARKMEQKQARLLASEDAWTHEVKMVAEARSDKHSFLKPEAFSDALSRAKSPISSPNPSGSKGIKSPSSNQRGSLRGLRCRLESAGAKGDGPGDEINRRNLGSFAGVSDGGAPS